MGNFLHKTFVLLICVSVCYASVYLTSVSQNFWLSLGKYISSLYIIFNYKIAVLSSVFWWLTLIIKSYTYEQQYMKWKGYICIFRIVCA